MSPSEGSSTSNSRYSKLSKGARWFLLDCGQRSLVFFSIFLSGGDFSYLILEDDEKGKLFSSRREKNNTNEIFVYTGTGTTVGAVVHVHVNSEQQRQGEKATETKTDPTGGESFLNSKEKTPSLMTDSMKEVVQIDDGEKAAPVISALKTTTSTTTQSSKQLSSAMKPTNHNNNNSNSKNNSNNSNNNNRGEGLNGARLY